MVKYLPLAAFTAPHMPMANTTPKFLTQTHNLTHTVRACSQFICRWEMVTLYQHCEPTDISNIETEGWYMEQYLGLIMQQNGSGIHYSFIRITVLQRSHSEVHVGDGRFSTRYEKQKNHRVKRSREWESAQMTWVSFQMRLSQEKHPNKLCAWTKKKKKSSP